MAQYTLIDDMVACLGCGLSDLAVLPQLKFQLRIGTTKALLKLGDNAAVAAATKLINGAQEIRLGPEAANTLLALNRPDIDFGEQVLFAALLLDASRELISGDKRAMVALSQIETIEHVWPLLRCLEDLLLFMVHAVSFDALSARIRGRADADIGLSIIFGRSQAASKESVIEGLSSHLNQLIKDTGGRYVISGSA
jgi:hypothetical protein